MSRPGSPNDNQIVEIHEYISNYYNIKRVHSGIGYLTPAEAYDQLLDNSSNPSLE